MFPNEGEWVFPPGVVLEQRKDLKDSMDADGERVECTTVELAPRLQRKWK